MVEQTPTGQGYGTGINHEVRKGIEPVNTYLIKVIPEFRSKFVDAFHQVICNSGSLPLHALKLLGLPGNQLYHKGS
jgi:hypothetical protein